MHCTFVCVLYVVECVLYVVECVRASVCVSVCVSVCLCMYPANIIYLETSTWKCGSNSATLKQTSVSADSIPPAMHPPSPIISTHSICLFRKFKGVSPLRSLSLKERWAMSSCTAPPYAHLLPKRSTPLSLYCWYCFFWYCC